MHARRLGRDEQLRADLAVRHAPGEQAHHLALPVGQRGQRARARRSVAVAYPGVKAGTARQVVQGRAEGRRLQAGRRLARRAPDGDGLVAAPGFHQRLGEPPLRAGRLVHVGGPEPGEHPLPAVR